jgi:hypothetical protein
MEELVKVRGRKFGAERVEADGKRFIDCEFSPGTVLVYSGGEPFLVEGSPSVQVEFEGPAAATLETLAVMQRCGLGGFIDQIFRRIRDPLGPTIN